MSKEINERIQQQKKRVENTEDKLREKKVKQESWLNQIKENLQKLKSSLQEHTIVPLTAHQIKGLDERFSRISDNIQLENLDKLTTTVVQSIKNEMEEIARNIHQCEKSVENAFGDFKRKWPMDATECDTSMISAPEYFVKLSRLKTDGLPAYEQRFFELMQNQSHQNLAALSTHLSQARKAILERMELVNESLSQAEFNPGTYLHIDPSDRQLPEVREFRQEIQKALSHAWNDDKDLTESRFITLKKLVERLASQDPEQKRWRESVLDVRLHVEFIAREIDKEGKEIEIYRSGAGKSGGQRQKLATTCLAAALRYQLGGSDHALPKYAPVVLDEAFDKADNEFTALAMNIFANFGFQMIVATPLKSVMTLEPFIGGACFVDISERRHSGTLMIEYDSTQHRLRLNQDTEGRLVEVS